jgi:uncharacterized membrane protein
MKNIIKHEKSNDAIKEYYAGVRATLKNKWWLYLLILFVSVAISGVSKLPDPEWLIYPVVGGVLIGFLILKDNIKALRSLRDEYKKDKKRNTKRMIFTFVIFFIMGYLVASVILKTNDNNSTNNLKKSIAFKTTFKNNFVSSCKKGSNQPNITEDMKQNYCACAADYLISTLGDRVYSDEYNAEVAKNGFSQQLTDGIAAKCLVHLKQTSITEKVN